MGLEWVLLVLTAVLAVGLAFTSTQAYIYLFWLLSLITGAVTATAIAFSLLRLSGIIDAASSGQNLETTSFTGMFYRLSDHPLLVMLGAMAFEAGLLFLYCQAIQGKNRKTR